MNGDLKIADAELYVIGGGSCHGKDMIGKLEMLGVGAEGGDSLENRFSLILEKLSDDLSARFRGQALLGSELRC